MAGKKIFTVSCVYLTSYRRIDANSLHMRAFG
jgi:hypothetical protein